MIPFYLDKAPVTTLAMFDPPAVGTSPRISVLICPQWGWDEVASFRTRRVWAERLAARGHATLRFELPGTGDSEGDHDEADLLGKWVTATGIAAEWLATSGPEDGTVAAIGLGLGGLILREAVNAGAPVSSMVLWGAPASGARFVREVRAFSRLQKGRPIDAEGDPSPSPLPSGALEVGGFVLSKETLADLKGLDPVPRGATELRRLLDLGRDGIAPDPEVAQGFRDLGVEVETGDGAGWEQMVGHPEQTRLPEETASMIDSWLSADGQDRPDQSVATVPAASAQTPDQAEIDVQGVAIRERPLRVPLDFGDAFGVLTEPADASRPGETFAVFLNAGAIRHIGPNRMWTETARRWATRGVPSLRVDLEGIGEAEGGNTGRGTVHDFYVPQFVGQVRGVLDAMETRFSCGRFVLVGLCAGAYWAFQASLGDPRVETAVLLNAGALTWADDILEKRQAQKLGRIREGRWWAKLLRGEIRLRRALYFARLAVRRSLSRGDRDGAGADLASDLDRSGPTRLVVAFSDGEPLFRELEYSGIIERSSAWPNLDLRRLPGSDHTLRSAAAQIAAAELLDEALPLDGRRDSVQSP